MQLEQAVRDVGMVVEEAAAADATVADAPQHAAVLAAQRAEQEARRAATARVEPVVAIEPARGLGERREREPVPRRDRLVVAERLRPLASGARAAALRRPASSSPRTIARPCSNGSSSAASSPSPSHSAGVHVYVSPSTPSVSASCAEAKPPLSSSISRSR